MEHIRRGWGFIFFASLFLIIVFYSNHQYVKDTFFEDKEVNADLKETIGNVDEVIEESQEKIVDDKSLYELDDDSNVYKLYITVLPPDESSVTMASVLDFNEESSDYLSDAEDPYALIYFEGDTPTYSNDLSQPATGSIELRGQSSRAAAQKSLKIKLFEEENWWDGFKTLNLNKHFSDKTRVKNKICYDYFERLSDIVGLRTRWVHLYVRDRSVNTSSYNYVDYGLFTFIEQPNKRFLKRHGLDKYGYLYKAEFFEFLDVEAAVSSTKEMTYDNDEFEKILETRGYEDNTKFVEMIMAVNDYSKDIDEIVDTYFDRDNLLTWLSVNILFNNYDTNSRNYMLYSSLNSKKWYFIPWDYDGSLNSKANIAEWQYGISNYWGMRLFNRFFRKPENIQQLSDKIEEVSQIINKENTSAYLDKYYNIVRNTFNTSMDRTHYELSMAEFKRLYFGISDLHEKYKDIYYKELEIPMPFYLGEPQIQGHDVKFNWESSYDFQQERVTYTFKLSKDPNMKNLIAESKNMVTIEYTVNNLQPGVYYWTVIATDASGHSQIPFDKADVDDEKYFGVKRFRMGEGDS